MPATRADALEEARGYEKVKDDETKPKIAVERPAIDWEELRTQATKLGLTLSEFQQQEKQRKLRLEKKAKPQADAG